MASGKGSMNTVAGSERMLSLLMFLCERNQPADRGQVAAGVEGYEGLEAGDAAAVKRFQRDVRALGPLGVKVDEDEMGRVRLDRLHSFSQSIDLAADELELLQLAGMAALEDPLFPYSDELKSALTKVANATVDTPTGLCRFPRVAASKSDTPVLGTVRMLKTAITERKAIAFGYTNNDGVGRRREVNPLDLLFMEDSWFLFADDREVEEAEQRLREYRVCKVEDIHFLFTGPGPDFPLPDFDLRDHIDFPFAFGPETPFEVEFLIPSDAPRTPDYVWEKARLSSRKEVPQLLSMKATARSVHASVAFALSYAPGTVPVAPENVVRAFWQALRGEEGDRGKTE